MKDEEIKKKAELNLDDLEDRGFDFDEWSIQDTYVNGAIFGAEIATKELKEENRQLKNEVEDLRAYCNQIGKVKTEVMKAFEYIVAR